VNGFKILRVPRESKDRDVLLSLKRNTIASTYDPEESFKIFFDSDHCNKQPVYLTKVKESVPQVET